MVICLQAPTISNESLDWDAFQIQRKPDWVQRAMWVPVYDQRHDQGGMSTPDGFRGLRTE